MIINGQDMCFLTMFRGDSSPKSRGKRPDRLISRRMHPLTLSLSREGRGDPIVGTAPGLCLAIPPLPRGESAGIPLSLEGRGAGVRVKARQGASRSPLTLSLSPEGRGNPLATIVQVGCFAFFPLPQVEREPPWPRARRLEATPLKFSILENPVVATGISSIESGA
jgi:hypothetical protein